MFRTSPSTRRRAALLGPMLGCLIGGNGLFADDACSIPPCPCPAVECYPGQWIPTKPLPSHSDRMIELGPSSAAPLVVDGLDLDNAPPPPIVPGLVNPSAPSATPPAPIAEPVANDFAAPTMDLSSGLVSNFGRGGATSLAFADTIATPGYIDSAVIQSRVRVRYDNATGTRIRPEPDSCT